MSKAIPILLVGGPEHGKVIHMSSLHREYSINISKPNPEMPRGYISDDACIPIHVFDNGDITVLSDIFEKKNYIPKKYMSYLYEDKRARSGRTYEFESEPRRVLMWAYFYEDLITHIQKICNEIGNEAGVETMKILKEHLFDALMRSWKFTHGPQREDEEFEEKAYARMRYCERKVESNKKEKLNDA